MTSATQEGATANLREPIPFDRNAREALGDPQLRRALQGLTTVSRERRQLVLASTGDWESLREHARAIKEETLQQLDRYLDQFATRAEAAGATVHWAETAEEGCAIVIELARRHGTTMVVKSKSMLSEELHLNDALDAAGITPVETDLGEWILQLAHEVPSHIVVPAIHKTRAEIARLFAATLGTPADADAATLTAAARQALRPAFAQATMGISGVNFGIAETGSILVLENEGNARFVTSVPRVHVAVMGIEKIIPRLADLDVFLKLLPRAGTGQRLTTYQSLITGIVARGERDRSDPAADMREGPDALHIVLVDHGRSRMLRHPLTRQSLACIRCGACLNVCPVYQQVGGHAYGSVYPGPIGAVITPQLIGLREAAQLQYASSLCGACRDVCPVKIDIPALLLHLRAQEMEGTGTRNVEATNAPPTTVPHTHARGTGTVGTDALGVDVHGVDVSDADAPPGALRGHRLERLAFRTWRVAMCSPWMYRAAALIARVGQRGVQWALGPQWDQRLGVIFPPVGAWTAGRDLRPLAQRSFRQTWAASVAGHHGSMVPECVPSIHKAATAQHTRPPWESATQVNYPHPHEGVTHDSVQNISPQVDSGHVDPTRAAIMRAIGAALAESERVTGENHQRTPQQKEHRTVLSGTKTPSEGTPAHASSSDQRVDQFMHTLTGVGGRCVRVRTVREGADAILESLRTYQMTRVGNTPPNDDSIGQLDIGVSDGPLVRDVLRDAAEQLQHARYVCHPIHTLTHDALFTLDAGITGVRWGVAETGTLVLTTVDEHNRLLSLIPPIHIAILAAASIRDTLADVLNTLQSDVEHHRAPGGGAVTLITGPSRTSDIELTLVLGVHGPRQLHVIVVDEPTTILS